MADTSTDLTERLALAGGGSDDDIDVIVKEAGLAAVVDALVTEVAFRCDEPQNTRVVHVGLELDHGDERRLVVLRVQRDRPVEVVDESAAELRSLLGFRLVDLVRRLYGRSGRRPYGDFRNRFMPQAPDPESMFRELGDILTAASQATSTAMSGCTAEHQGLGRLAVRYGSDKWASFHWYAPHYERHFAPFRDEPVRILEIGIGGYDEEVGGGSLRAWKRFFHRGTVFGLDIFDKTELNEPRLTALVGDQNDPEALAEVVRRHGPFDIVIDDGSHMNEHIYTSFRTLFPLLRPGGLYVVEDLQTAYFPAFGGSAGHTAEPHTSVGLVKSLLDDLHHQEREPADRERTVTEATVTGVHAYHNIVFVEKGVNGEDGLPAWMNADAWEALGATDS